MKTKLILIFGLVISLNMTAQTNGINYKALLKDNSGAILANSNISVIFSIRDTNSEVYREGHTTTTDTNGLFILNIGEGTPTIGVFSSLDWSTNDHTLNVEVDTGNGFVNFGATAFKTVPYAYQAANVSGLEKITESGNEGFRLIGQTANNYGNIGLNAVDLSFSNDANSTTNGATGFHSVAMGLATKSSNILTTAMGAGSDASGIIATAMGNFTEASGNYSTSVGDNTIASGGAALATGVETEADGYGSTSFGDRTKANGGFTISMGALTNADAAYSVVMGRHNIGGGHLTQWIGTDPIFEIGNGVNSVNTNNALTVLKNGTILAPTFNISEITDPKALITKEYAEAAFSSSSLMAINEGSGFGYRLNDKDPSNYGNIGLNAIDLSNQTLNAIQGATGDSSVCLGSNTWSSGGASFAMGSSSIASGTFSTAMGFSADATGYASLSIGNNTLSSGDSSVSFGASTQAIGPHSLATGLLTTANGNYSSAFGNQTTAYSFNETVFGRYNTIDTPTAVNSWALQDRLFVIGNGTSDTNRKNAFIVLKNGNVGMGLLQNFDPLSTLHINGADVISTSAASGTLIIGHNNNERLAIDDNEIMVRSFTNNPTTLHLQRFGGSVAVGGAVVHSSDRRLKRNITDLKYGLKEVLQLQPKQYFWKDRNGQKDESLGVIAQEIQAIIPNVVEERDNAQKTLSVSYTELIPVLINAIKEQQKIIDNQNNKIENLTSEVTTLKTLESRLQQIETLLKNTQ